ncbi:MAG: hypothetical protein ACOYMN_01525 [Roseimicrobium sp.]
MEGEGLKTFTENDQLSESKIAALAGSYQGVPSVIEKALELYEVKSFVELVVGDACKTVPEFFANHPEMLVSFAYFDFDLYQPTITALEALRPSMTTGGLIVFDQANYAVWAGEGQALKEFFHNHPGDYAYESIPYTHQPTAALRRL